jgi:hypothetical protein
VNTGGEALVSGGVQEGYGRLHALNACATSELDRVRWIADVPSSTNRGYSLGAPTVTNGIVYVTTDLGHVVALADPTVSPAAGSRCSNVDVSVANCAAAGFAVVPTPTVLADVALPDGTSAAGLRNEAAIAGGRLFVGTSGGHVYMLSATAPPTPCAKNACGGCGPLYAAPATGCEAPGDVCGKWKCTASGALVCDTTQGTSNTCGGCVDTPIAGINPRFGGSCTCPNVAGDGHYVCNRARTGLTCCSCGAMPGCGPGAP